MKQYLSATAFARLTGKDPKTVISWIEKEMIPNVQRMGNIYRIPHEEVEKAKLSDQYPPKEVWPT